MTFIEIPLGSSKPQLTNCIRISKALLTLPSWFVHTYNLCPGFGVTFLRDSESGKLGFKIHPESRLNAARIRSLGKHSRQLVVSLPTVFKTQWHITPGIYPVKKVEDGVFELPVYLEESMAEETKTKDNDLVPGVPRKKRGRPRKVNRELVRVSR